MPPSHCTQCGTELRRANMKAGTTLCYSCYSRQIAIQPTDHVAVTPRPATQQLYEQQIYVPQPALQPQPAVQQLYDEQIYEQPRPAVQPQPTTQITQTFVTQQPSMQGIMRVDRKKPWLAALLGIMIVGFGHFYLGEWFKGIVLLILTIVISPFTLFLAAPVFWVISCVWAYSDAKAYNRRAGYPE